MGRTRHMYARKKVAVKQLLHDDENNVKDLYLILIYIFIIILLIQSVLTVLREKSISLHRENYYFVTS